MALLMTTRFGGKVVATAAGLTTASPGQIFLSIINAASWTISGICQPTVWPYIPLYSI